MSKAIVSATEFKAKCLDLLDQISSGELDELAVTKRGRIVARLVPPVAPVRQELWHGFMQGSLELDPGIDLTQPVSDEPWDADLGVLHR